MSDENDTLGGSLGLSPRSVARVIPEAVSHNRTVRSMETDASFVLSGEKEIYLIREVWPRSVINNAPEIISRTCTLASDAEAIFSPSSENTKAWMARAGSGKVATSSPVIASHSRNRSRASPFAHSRVPSGENKSGQPLKGGGVAYVISAISPQVVVSYNFILL